MGRWGWVGYGLACGLLAVNIGCGGSSGDCDLDTTLDISGAFSERFNCDEGGTCVDEDVTITVNIGAGSENPDGSFSYPFNDPDSSWSGAGTLCGTVFTWTASAALYVEAGVWVFSDADHFEKASDYTWSDGDGSCTGMGTRVGVGTPPAPAPIGACP